MNKKAAFNGSFWTVITLIFFVPFWAFFLGPQLSYWGALVVTGSNLTGYEALFWNNLNVLVFFALLIYVFLSGGGD